MPKFCAPLPSPKQIGQHVPLSERCKRFVLKARATAQEIMTGRLARFVLFVGPCSIHSPRLALDYAHKLRALAAEVNDHFFLVMRVFLEKPRTQFGWKGFLYDPFLDDSLAVKEGLYHSRALLCDLADVSIPVATEFLDPLLSHYSSDLITWGMIGARTSASQIHRQMASALPMPIGFKNDVNGHVDQAIFSALAARHPQTFTGINADGRLCAAKSVGNPYTHIILRGGVTKSNYDSAAVADALDKQRLFNLEAKLIVDCAHGNAQKQAEKQKKSFSSVVSQYRSGNRAIMGAMLESHLRKGRLLSLTDPCLDWETTQEMILAACAILERSAS